ncbi:MAG: DMT family transporter [Alkalispirochaeta sp.]
MLRKHTPELMVLAAAALWGTSGPVTQLAALPAGVISFFRMAIPTVVIGGVFAVRRHRLSRKGLGLRLTASALNAIRMLFFFLAYQYTTVANAVVTLYTWPIFAAIFARIVLGERVSRERVLLLGLAFTGIPLLYLNAVGSNSRGSDDVIGISSMLVSAAFHALAIVLLKRAKPGGSRLESTFFQNIVGAAVFLPVVLVLRPELTVVQLSLVVYLGLVVGTLGFTLFFIGLHGASTARMSNLAYFEVVVAIILSVVVLQQPIYWNTVVGGILIIVSVLVAQGRRVG